MDKINKQVWQTKKIGDVCNIIGGGTPSKANDGLYSGDILWATVRDMKSDVIKDTEYKINIDAVRNSSTNIIPKNNIVIATRVGLGKVCILENDTAINQDLKGIVPKNISKLSVRFLYWWLKSISKLIEENGTGATVHGVKLSFIKNLEIPLPSLSEQKRIVKILDEVFMEVEKAKKNADKNLQNSRDLFGAYLRGVFEKKGGGWEEKSLGDIAVVQSGGTPLRAINEYWIGSIPWYSSGELNELYTTVSERNISNMGLDNSNAKIFPKGSLLIGMYDTAALKMSILDRDAAFNQAIAGVKPNPKINLVYTMHAINAFKSKILAQRHGTRQNNLNLGQIKNIMLCFPTLSEQKTIVEKLDTLSNETKKLEEIYKKEITDLEELKKSVLQKAFNGEL